MLPPYPPPRVYILVCSIYDCILIRATFILLKAGSSPSSATFLFTLLSHRLYTQVYTPDVVGTFSQLSAYKPFSL